MYCRRVDLLPHLRVRAQSLPPWSEFALHLKYRRLHGTIMDIESAKKSSTGSKKKLQSDTIKLSSRDAPIVTTQYCSSCNEVSTSTSTNWCQFTLKASHDQAKTTLLTDGALVSLFYVAPLPT
jgi:hypothetical protein